MTDARTPRSRWYDGRVYATVVDRVLAGVRGYLVTHLPPGDRVLDACCGTGALAIALAEQGRTVTGVELSPDHVAHARRAAERAGLGPDRVRFELADVATLDAPDDGRWDVATIALALHEMPADARHAVVDRLLDVAARVVLVDFATPLPRSVNGVRTLAAELAAGPAHALAFRDYQRRGGLDALLPSDAVTHDERRIDGGALRVLTIGRPS